MLQMVEKSSVKISSEQLRDLLDIKIKMSAKEARKLALEGKLPNNVIVAGNLDLSGIPITSLPKGLSVCGNLYLSGTPSPMPEGLQVGGDIWLGNTRMIW